MAFNKELDDQKKKLETLTQSDMFPDCCAFEVVSDIWSTASRRQSMLHTDEELSALLKIYENGAVENSRAYVLVAVNNIQHEAYSKVLKECGFKVIIGKTRNPNTGNYVWLYAKNLHPRRPTKNTSKKKRSGLRDLVVES